MRNKAALTLIELSVMLAVFALAAAHNGGEKLKPCALGHGFKAVNDFINRLLADFPAANGAVRNSYSGI